MNKKLRIQIGGFAILAAFGYIVLQGAHNFSNYFLTVGQYRHDMTRFSHDAVRVQGTMQAQSVHYNRAKSLLTFTLVYNGQSLPIIYEGPLPNEQFRDANAIVKGRMGSHGVFDAQKLEIQCPDHYSAAPNAKH
jgi:cytochrome c-type biogenesis protein CcmE